MLATSALPQPFSSLLGQPLAIGPAPDHFDLRTYWPVESLIEHGY